MEHKKKKKKKSEHIFIIGEQKQGLGPGEALARKQNGLSPVCILINSVWTPMNRRAYSIQ
jgi:hypothetical protein